MERQEVRKSKTRGDFREMIEQLAPYFSEAYGIRLTETEISWTQGGYQGPKTLYREGEHTIKVREEYSYSRAEIASRVTYHLGEQAIDENTPLGTWEREEIDDKLIFEITNEVGRTLQLDGLRFVRTERTSHPAEVAALYAKELQIRFLFELARTGPPVFTHRHPLYENDISVAEFFDAPAETYLELLKPN